MATRRIVVPLAPITLAVAAAAATEAIADGGKQATSKRVAAVAIATAATWFATVNSTPAVGFAATARITTVAAGVGARAKSWA
jgi:hypothetical protein